VNATPGTVTRRAYAKVNPVLRVLGRRADGYHDIETLILPVELHDVVEVSAGEALAVEVSGERAEDLDRAGGEDLAVKAALALADACGFDLDGPAGVTVRIDKRIPVAAGLGGGSADAAATLRALRDLWPCDVGEAKLADLAATIGSDVPALLAGGAVHAAGRGERVQSVHVQTCWWVVRPFAFAVRTSDAYAWWDADGAETGPDPGALVAALETGNGELAGSALFNDLQAPVVRRHPEIEAILASLLESGALGAIMSGSGPTMVGLARHLADADRIAAAVPGSFVTSGPPLPDPAGSIR
jgi:4-diphosphocytidyl-2-C-methyl-D-erythritol kinase